MAVCSFIQQQNWNPSCSNYIVIGTILIWNCSQITKNLYYRDSFFLIKPTDALIYPNLFLSRHSTCFGQFLCPLSGVLHCIFGTGICHASLMTAFKHVQDGTPVPSWTCLKAVHWRTPDDGQRNCPKHAEFLDKKWIWKIFCVCWFY
jgi:hypothetical protein